MSIRCGDNDEHKVEKAHLVRCASTSREATAESSPGAGSPRGHPAWGACASAASVTRGSRPSESKPAKRATEVCASRNPESSRPYRARNLFQSNPGVARPAVAYPWLTSGTATRLVMRDCPSVQKQLMSQHGPFPRTRRPTATSRLPLSLPSVTNRRPSPGPQQSGAGLAGQSIRTKPLVHTRGVSSAIP